jgi:hypothetical protein
MKKYQAVNLALVSMLTIAAQSTAAADGFGIKAGVGTSSYVIPLTGGKVSNINVNYQTLNVGASYVDLSSGWFVDVTNRSPLGSASWNTHDFLFANNGTPVPDSPAKRTENTLTIGKVLEDGLQVFAGYQMSDLTLSANVNAISTSPAFDLFSVKEDGLFAGAGKSLKIAGGNLNITGALAMMGAKIATNNGNNLSEATYDPGLGYSFGASYSYPLTNMLNIVPEAKYQTFKPNGFTARDTLTSFAVSIAARF